MSSWSAPAALPAWLLVLLCAVSGAYCLGRVRRAGRRARGAVAGDALMGLGMAAMAAPPGIGPWGPQVLLAVFCGAVLHALWLLRGGLHHAHHLVGSLAMAYMALTVAPGHGAGLGAGAGVVGVGPWAAQPLVTAVLLVYFAGYVLLGGARLLATGPQALPAGAGGGSPAVAGAVGGRVAAGSAELARACRLAMGMGMLAMLLGM
ncbi:DUF5134 domain-containing protein [Streptomyces sp. NPDC059851]|uniref:DUF5134 domain-containing protein n=1 Tax=Streptomyces sp. NPDC059851 TaxID=3346971 RepID=UPI00365BF9B7